MFQPRLVLHPTDFSVCSRYALRISGDLARLHGAGLLVLHVAETLGPENVTHGEATGQLQPEGYRRRLSEDLRQARLPAEYAIFVEYLLAEGDPAGEIVRVAEARRCDLVVMGTHGRTGLERLLMGSVAEHVVRHASCPVLTVKVPPVEDR